MKEKTDKILEIWHEYFADEEKQYSEFESSDIEYFVGCLLYNHFAFSKALDTMKTIDVSYDFLVATGDGYDEVKNQISEIKLNDEVDKIEFLQAYFLEVKSKYTQDELYLLNRLEYHFSGVVQRYQGEIEASKVDFVAPKARSKNPLLR